MTDLPVDEREWGVPFLRKRAEWHAEESAKLKALPAPHRDALGAILFHERQVVALRHEAELIEKGATE